MLTESIAQNMPPHIIESILSYTLSKTKTARKGKRRLWPPRDRALLRFTRLCRQWGAVAMSLYHRTGTIVCMHCPDSDTPYVVNTRGVLSITRVVALSIPPGLIIDGDLHAIMEGPPLANAVFASVSWLDLQFWEPEMPIADLTAELVERLKYFSTQLRRLFPNASTIRHRKQLSFSTSPELAKPAVEGIVRLVWLHELYVRDRLSDLVEEAPAVGLTRIHLVDRFAPVEFLEIVRRNAPTLVDLCISSMYRNIYKDVVLDSEGAVVVYPNLKRFEASVTVYFGPTELASQPSPEGVLFPVLQHLSVLGSYLFSNDLLFRGNNTTLEYLTLGIDTNILETIETHHLFKPNSYPQLHYLDFLSRNIEHSATEQDAQALLRTPFNLGPNLQVVKIGTSVYQLGPTILNCVQQSMLSSEIQHLDIGGILLSLNDAVSLVKVLPNLTMLGCGLHIEIEGQTKYLRAKDVKQLYTDYFPVRSRLWYLKAEGNTRRPLRVMGELACVFAILVPSIYRIGFQNYAGENRSYICKQAYKRPAFKRYADRFDALRFD